MKFTSLIMSNSKDKILVKDIPFWASRFTNIIINHKSNLAYLEKGNETPLWQPNLFYFIPKPIRTHFFSCPFSLTLKKNLLPFVFSFKYLHKFLKIELNTSESDHWLGIFMVEFIRRRRWTMNPRGILEDLSFLPS